MKSLLPLLAAAGLLFPIAHLQAQEEASSVETKKAVFGAGCFWCVEAFYEAKPGVIEVVSGYAGGEKPNPTYEEVSRAKTKHAEVVEVTYDPSKITYQDLVEFFWTTHDVTDGSGVWPDFGPQYRSIILYADEEQKKVAEESKAALEASGKLKKPVATEIVELKKFYPAEDYHQDYVKKNPNDPYVQRIAIPKMKKLGIEKK